MESGPAASPLTEGAFDTHEFAERPRLKRAPSGRVGRFGICDFRNVMKARGLEMCHQRRHESRSCFFDC
jgi:hypothetical protein